MRQVEEAAGDQLCRIRPDRQEAVEFLRLPVLCRPTGWRVWAVRRRRTQTLTPTLIQPTFVTTHEPFLAHQADALREINRMIASFIDFAIAGGINRTVSVRQRTSLRVDGAVNPRIFAVAKGCKAENRRFPALPSASRGRDDQAFVDGVSNRFRDTRRLLVDEDVRRLGEGALGDLSSPRRRNCARESLSNANVAYSCMRLKCEEQQRTADYIGGSSRRLRGSRR